MRLLAGSIGTVLSLGVLGALGGFGSGCSDEPGYDDVREDMFISDPDPADILEVDFTYVDGSTQTRSVIVDQLLLGFDRDITSADARSRVHELESELSDVSLKLAGQIPSLGIYQLEIDNPETSPAAAIALLDGVIERLREQAGVDTVSYNELLSSRFAENDDDNSAEQGPERAAFAIVDYFQAVPVFDKIFARVALNPIKVAVIDSGIDFETGQFDQIQALEGGITYLDVGYPDLSARDIHPQKHGTGIAGLIAADNGDGVTNGIALRVLGDRLSLYVGNVHLVGNLYHAARSIEGCELAIEAGARIINISHGANARGATPSWLVDARETYTRLFDAEASRDVLFVVAASNDRLLLADNDVPAGIVRPNVLTVGGLLSGNLSLAYPASATGPRIEVAAPATDVPTCCYGNAAIGHHRYHANGNSFAAPIVASIAAIIRSVDPGMSAAELKRLLTDPESNYPGPEAVGGIRPALLKTVGTALLQVTSSGAVEDVMDLMYGIHDNVPDPSGHMINRLVGAVDFTVSGPDYLRHYAFGPDQLSLTAAGYNFGVIGPDYVQVGFGQEGEKDVISVGIDAPFELGRTYLIPAEGGFGIAAGGAGGDFIGSGSAGGLTFTECEITTRSLPLNYFDSAPPTDLSREVFIEAAGVLTGGQAEGVLGSDPPEYDVTYDVSASFTTAFRLIGLDASTMDRLEQRCLGGYQQGP